MSKQKQKYYVVWQGHNPGIYSSWEKCQAQVKNYPNAVYKSFLSKEEAEEAFRSSPARKRSYTAKWNMVTTRNIGTIDLNSISVDAACSGNPGLMEYRGVHTSDKAELFHVGPLANGTNNIGEFLAIVHALAILKKKNDSSTPIYTDSKTALSWIKAKKANTKLKKDSTTREIFDLIIRAEKWLHTHDWKNPLLKWETEHWGEIPADFGRK